MLVVQHISADATGNVLLDALNKNSKLKCSHAENGTKLEPGHLYIAPSDHHLMIDDNERILITKGAQENRSRPAIDPLFRSAAVVFGARTIGILLTGYLDDGTAGLKVIKKCGVICIVQDPVDADYPDMPKNALTQVKVDYCLPISKMGDLLYKLMSRKISRRKQIPENILIETEIAKRVLAICLLSMRLVSRFLLIAPVVVACCGGSIRFKSAIPLPYRPCLYLRRTFSGTDYEDRRNNVDCIKNVRRAEKFTDNLIQRTDRGGIEVFPRACKIVTGAY